MRGASELSLYMRERVIPKTATSNQLARARATVYTAHATFSSLMSPTTFVARVYYTVVVVALIIPAGASAARLLARAQIRRAIDSEVISFRDVSVLSRKYRPP